MKLYNPGINDNKLIYNAIQAVNHKFEENVIHIFVGLNTLNVYGINMYFTLLIIIIDGVIVKIDRLVSLVVSMSDY